MYLRKFAGISQLVLLVSVPFSSSMCQCETVHVAINENSIAFAQDAQINVVAFWKFAISLQLKHVL